MVAFGVGIPAVVFLFLLLQGCDGGEDDKCPPWHFTPANATTPCSECSFPETDDFYCSDTGLIIDTSLIVTATEASYPLVIGKGIFGQKLNHTNTVLFLHSIIFFKLPPNISELEDFFCSGSKRQGFLCGQCKPGCGIAIYTYYGLPCECPCYSYGIPLYILLEIGFSTLFFAVLVMINFSANSSRWITIILYFKVVAHVISSDPYIYIVLAKSGDWVPIVLQSLYGIWNMDFLRLVIPRFCVSQGVSILGAISTGYISAFWPLVLVVLTSLAMHLHKRNFKLVVNAWNFINWASHGFFQRQVNLIYSFATFFVLSYLNIVYISICLMKPYHTLQIFWVGQQLKTMHLLSSDPFVNFLSRGHLLYAIPASIVLVLIGMLLPLVLILYPTRCGTWLGGRLQSGRLRNAVRTFVEAMNGSYKDGSSGTRDFRSLPGLMLLLIGVITIVIAFRESGIAKQVSCYLCICLLVLALAAFYGILRPYKSTRHNLFDVLIYCLIAAQCIYFYSIVSYFEYDHGVLAITMFIPFLIFVANLLKPFAVYIVNRRQSVSILN